MRKFIIALFLSLLMPIYAHAAVVMQQTRDTAANWTANNPTLAQGQIGIETDTGNMKFGNGSSAWNSLSYFSGTGANQALSNLTGVAINTALLPGAFGTINLGSASYPFKYLFLTNPATTYSYSLQGAAIGGNYNLTLPLITANDTLPALGIAQTWSAQQRFNTNYTLFGTASSKTGGIELFNASGSGGIQITPANPGSTVFSITVPADTGTLLTSTGNIAGATSASQPFTDGITLSAANITTDTSTGTDIATATNQKLGFYGVTPVVQQTGNVCTALNALGIMTSCSEQSLSSYLPLSGGTLTGNLTISTHNIVTDTSTGSDFGTATNQLIGFYGATPIAQTAATTDLGTVLSGLGLRAAGTAYPITTSGIVTLTGRTNITIDENGAEYNNGTCTTSATIDPANGRNQKVTLTNGDVCALTLTQPAAGTAIITLKIIQSAVSTYNGTISGCTWAGGTAMVPTATTGAVDFISIYEDGTHAYCGVVGQAFS